MFSLPGPLLKLLEEDADARGFTPEHLLTSIVESHYIRSHFGAKGFWVNAISVALATAVERPDLYGALFGVDQGRVFVRAAGLRRYWSELCDGAPPSAEEMHAALQTACRSVERRYSTGRGYPVGAVGTMSVLGADVIVAIGEAQAARPKDPRGGRRARKVIDW